MDIGFSVCLGAAIGNFLWQSLTELRWEVAIHDTLLQVVAVAVLMLVQHFRELSLA